jgi:hypothetical protein
MDGSDDPAHESELISRAPTEDDLVNLCRALNSSGARYIVVGGFAIIQAGLLRTTSDLDLLVDSSLVNEAKVFSALEILPDKAVRELKQGEIAGYTVVRVADEIVVDLMASTSGIEYEEAARQVVVRRIQDTDIPFASPRLLWRMKKTTHREKDAQDLLFLKQHYAAEIDEELTA